MLVAACTEKAAEVDPGGRISVLGPDLGFSTITLSDDWITSGDITHRVINGTREGIPALTLLPSADGFFMVRRTRAHLLVSPYLSWAWRVDLSGHDLHPVSLVVGFSSDRTSSSAYSHYILPTDLPEHDRALVLGWSNSALGRGSFVAPADDMEHPAVARYIVRGGAENTDTWWIDTVDLADLYGQSWPNDALAHVKTVFIGVGIANEADAGASISGIMLSR